MNKCHQCNLVTCTYAGYDKPACQHFEQYDHEAEEARMEINYENQRYEQDQALWAEQP